MTEVAKVTSKGQVVIPAEIRRALGLEEGSRLAVSRAGDFVVMRKVEIPDLEAEFEELTRLGRALAEEKGIESEEDVVEAIHRGRGVGSD